ncbi:MAG: TIGR02679 family protein [Micromonosporaceae bacterium]|jgi:TIGR02679 family protein|nr:TIGR02679 family protein [Micromonosporaceae bacterium]
MSVDTEPAVDPARDPDWARLLEAARRSLERSGGSLAGSVTIARPTDGERRVVIGITGVHRPAGVQRIAVRLADVDLHLRQLSGRGLIDTLTEAGAPLRDRPGERRREALARQAALARARASACAGQEWFDRWLDWLRGDGMLTRLVRAGGDLTPVLRVLEALPAADEPLPAFAERVLGDTKAFSDASLRGLVLRAVALWQGAPPPTSAEQERALWEAVGVVPDDLASHVLVLNVPARGGVVGEWLTQAAALALPMRLTLHQLRLGALAIDAEEIFVTENPAVLRAATALGPAAPPLVCTEGMPSAALHRLLAVAGRATLRWRHDFDWPGVRMLTAALARYPAAVPWRMSAADYEAALGPAESVGGSGPRLTGTPAATPWDPALAAAMHRHGRAVMEERLLPVLLDDLRAASGGSG